jgi:hypothetical protein
MNKKRIYIILKNYFLALFGISIIGILLILVEHVDPITTNNDYILAFIIFTWIGFILCKTSSEIENL